MNEDIIESDIKKKIAKGGIWALTGKILTAILGFFSNILLVRILAPNDFGIFVLIQTIVNIYVMFVLLGFDGGIVKFISFEIANKTEGNIPLIIKKIFYVIILSFVISSILFITGVGNVLSKGLNTPEIKQFEWLIVGWVFFAVFQRILAEIFRGMHRIDYATVFGGSLRGGIIYSIVFCAALFLYKEAGNNMNLEIIFIIVISSILISFLPSVFFLIKELRKIFNKNNSRNSIKLNDYFKIVLPMLASSIILILFSRSDIWIISIYSSKEKLAVYGAVIRLVNLVNYSLLIVNLVLPPVISELYTKGELKTLELTLRNSASLAAIPAGIVLIIFILVPGSFLDLIYGEFYVKGNFILIILSIGLFFNVWGGSCGMTLLMTGNQNFMLLVSVVSSLFTLGLTIIFIQNWDIIGVAIAATIGLITKNIMMVYFVKKKLNIWTQIHTNPFVYRKLIKKSFNLLNGIIFNN